MKPEARLRSRCRAFGDSHVLLPTYWTAIEHGRKHSGTDEQRAREWGRLKAQGVKEGIADLMYQVPGFTLWVECKSGKNKQQPAQIAFMEAQLRIGNGYEIVRSVEALGEALERHGIPLAPGWRVAAMHHDAALEAPPKGHNKPPRAVKPRGNRKQVARWNTAMLAMAKGGGE